MIARGTFNPNIQPQKSYASGQDGVTLSRMSIDKTFAGDLEATSVGEMLAAMTTTEGSAGYVAIEQVSGSLNGWQGSFVLQHNGIMHAGQSRLTLEIVPDSGTGELAGISGSMQIDTSGDGHSYVLEYGIAASRE